MKKITLLLLSLVIMYSCSSEDQDEVIMEEEQVCDNGTFVGNVRLFTQTEIDEFGAMCYSKIEGNLNIGIPFDLESDISDLTPLSTLTELYQGDDPAAFGGALVINAYSLSSLAGLENIASVTSLAINRCEELIDLTGLEGLEQVTGTMGDTFQGRVLIGYNSQLTSLSGLDNLTSVGSESSGVFTFSVGYNPLQSLDGLANLTTIKGDSFLGGLHDLVSLDGLDSLESVDGDLLIGNNFDLISLDGLDSLQMVYGDLTVGANMNLQNIDGLSNLVEVNGDISTLSLYDCSNCSPSPVGNDNLTDLCGFQNLLTNGSYGNVEIIDNAYNPTVEDIIAGNCNI